MCHIQRYRLGGGVRVFIPEHVAFLQCLQLCPSLRFISSHLQNKVTNITTQNTWTCSIHFPRVESSRVDSERSRRFPALDSARDRIENTSPGRSRTARESDSCDPAWLKKRTEWENAPGSSSNPQPNAPVNGRVLNHTSFVSLVRERSL